MLTFTALGYILKSAKDFTMAFFTGVFKDNQSQEHEICLTSISSFKKSGAQSLTSVHSLAKKTQTTLCPGLWNPWMVIHVTFRRCCSENSGIFILFIFLEEIYLVILLCLPLRIQIKNNFLNTYRELCIVGDRQMNTILTQALYFMLRGLKLFCT